MTLDTFLSDVALARGAKVHGKRVRKVYVGDELVQGERINLLRNPTFERVVAGTTIGYTNRFPEPIPATAAVWDVARMVRSFHADPEGAFVRGTSNVTGTPYFNLLTPQTRMAVAPGELVRFSAEVRLGNGGKNATIRLYFMDAQGAIVQPTPPDSPAHTAEGWGRITAEGVAPATAAYFGAYVMLSSQSPIGSTLDVRKVYAGAPCPFYFDGSTVDDSGFAYSWTGPASASPSTAKASGVTIRRNYNPNPRVYPTAARWATTPSVATLTATPNGGQIDSASGTQGGAVFFNATHVPAASGDLWTASLEVSVPPGAPAASVILRVHSYGQEQALAESGTVTIQPGTTVTVTATSIRAATAATTGVRMIVYGVSLPAGSRLIVRHALLEKAAVVGPYFDGYRSSDSDLVPQWSGTPDDSEAILVGARAAWAGAGVCFPVRSSQWATPDKWSLRVISNYGTRGSAYVDLASVDAGTLERGKTYTALATVRKTAATDYSSGFLYYVAPNSTTSSAHSGRTPGVFPLRVTFTVGETGYGYLRLYNGGQIGDPDVWFDDVVLIEGVYDGPPFSGDTPGAGWLGPRHDSYSAIWR